MSMGFFFSSPEEKYSIDRHTISDLAVKELVSHFRAPNLSDKEEDLVEAALLTKKRQHEGKLSLRDVFTILHHFKGEHQISENDLREVMKQFEQHLGKI